MHARDAVLTVSMLALLVQTPVAKADPVPVRYPEGSVHGYLSLRSPDGGLLASGDLTQTVHRGRLTSRLIYRFKDGSIDDDTAVFTQNGHFRLLTDHHVQRGPAFPESMDVLIEARTGQVTVQYAEGGETKVETTHMELPDDLANGILLDVVKNLPARGPETRISYVAATPKPRLVHLVIGFDGTDRFRSAGRINHAHRFRIHVQVGGVAGVVAPLIGKQPPDSLAWVSAEEVPAFIRSESPLTMEGPLLRTELVGPVWEPLNRGLGAFTPK